MFELRKKGGQGAAQVDGRELKCRPFLTGAGAKRCANSAC
jgi:hypothetical protein